MTEDLFQKMSQSILDGDSDAAVALAKQAIEAGIDPLDAISKGFVVGVNQVGITFFAVSSGAVTTGITPTAATRFAGGSVTFSAVWLGTLPMAFQWQVDKGSGPVDLPGQTNAALTLNNLRPADAGSYTLTVTNVVGPANAPTAATLTVFERMNDPSIDGVAHGYLTMGRLEIARCDNDPNRLDHGIFVLHMDGGK